MSTFISNWPLNTSTEIIQTSTKCREAIRDKDINPILYDVLTHATPYGFEYLIHPIIFKAIKNCNHISGFGIDKIGNIYISIGKKNVDYKTVFSCHMDTVHIREGNKAPPIITPLIVDYPNGDMDQTNGMIYGSRKIKTRNMEELIIPSILGADDKVGVYICIRLIQNATPGLYVFHVGEERGCIGSRYSVEKNKNLFKGMQRCIAFDRMNYTDVISHQRGKECASSEFTWALANKINEKTETKFNQFKGSVTGVFTDSANYEAIIPECTNLSVGYFGHHGSDEHFDLVWLEGMLIPALLKVEFEDLPTARAFTKPSTPLISWKKDQKQVNSTGHTIDPKVLQWTIKDGFLDNISEYEMRRLIGGWIGETSVFDMEREILQLLKLKSDKIIQPNIHYLNIRTLSILTLKYINYITKLFNQYNNFIKVKKLSSAPLMVEYAEAFKSLRDKVSTTKQLSNADELGLTALIVLLFRMCMFISNINPIDKHLKKYSLFVVNELIQDKKLKFPKQIGNIVESKKSTYNLLYRSGKNTKDYNIEAYDPEEACKLGKIKLNELVTNSLWELSKITKIKEK